MPLCAFANEPGLGGGWLLLGMMRGEQALFPSYQVEGVPQPDKPCADLATQCRETFNLPVRIELSTEQVSGQPVVVAFVPEALADYRQTHAQANPDGLRSKFTHPSAKPLFSSHLKCHACTAPTCHWRQHPGDLHAANSSRRVGSHESILLASYFKVYSRGM